MPDRLSVHREVERKLRVPPDFPLVDLQAHGVVARLVPGQAFQMTAAYHDTEDVRLLRWGATLRRRQGGPDEGWHLKLPVPGADAGTRDELHLPLWAGSTGFVPAELADVVAPFTRGARLVPVAWVHTTRAPSMLFDADGNELAELADDRVQVQSSDGRVLAEFREIEIEACRPSMATDATPTDSPAATGVIDRLEAIDRIAAILVAHGAEPSTASKAAAALGRLAAAPPDIDLPSIPGQQEPTRVAVRWIISRSAREIVLADVAVRRGLVDSVGQLRAATGRLHGLLGVLEPLLDADWVRTVQEELAWLAREMGAVRDTDALAGRLHDQAAWLGEPDADMARTTIDEVLRLRLTGARGGALAALRSERHDLLLEDLVHGSQDPPVTTSADRPCAAVLPALITHAWRRLNRPARRLRTGADGGDWDRVRIRVERMNHAIEAISPIFPEHGKRLARRLAQAAEVLGEQRDAQMAQQVLREIAAHPATTAPAAFALGRLRERQAACERDSRRSFIGLWPSVRQSAKRTWMA